MPNEEAEAATFHRLNVASEANGYSATVVLDV
jgi:SHS2 domain-containing protein